MSLDKAQIGLAGEFYVLAQLTARGFIATLTLGNTKGVDILVTNQEIDKLFKVEVKTTTNEPAKSKLFADGRPCYEWTMGKKHETIIEENLIYCFVSIKNADELPLFFLVPSEQVAKYVKWQHEYWLSTRTNWTEKTNTTTMRKFRIETSDPKEYKDNWNIFR